MNPALIWLVIGIVLVGSEVLSGDFVLLMLGIGALAAAASSELTGNVFIDVVVFAVASVGLLFLARPALKRRFLAGPGVQTNTDALIGAQAVAISTVDSETGQVKLAGEVWSARSYLGHEPIPPGTKVTVVEIAGATAVVSAEP
jgi:membrane protein implicated in regulation of membrane protease activity